LSPTHCYVLVGMLVDETLTMVRYARLATHAYSVKYKLWALVNAPDNASAKDVLQLCFRKGLIDWPRLAYYLDRYLYLKDKIEKDRVGLAISETWGDKAILKPTQYIAKTKHDCKYCTCHWDDEAVALSSLSGVKNWTHYYAENAIDKNQRKRFRFSFRAFDVKANLYSKRWKLKRKDKRFE